MSEIREADELLRFAAAAVARALAAGADAADCFVREGRTLGVTCKGDLATATESHNVGFAVRTMLGDRIGFASSSGLHRTDAVVDEALAAARGATPTRQPLGFQPPVPNPRAPSRVHDAIWAPDAARIHAASEAVLAGLDAPDVTFRAVAVTTGRNRWALANSEGHTAWDQGGRESVSFEARIERATRQVTTMESWTGLRPVEEAVDLQAFARQTRERARSALDAKPLPHAVEEVILDTAPCGQVVKKFIGGLSGALAQSGQSPLAGRLGEKVAAKGFTLVDAPHGNGNDQRLRSDHEGVPTQDVRLVEDGVLGAYLHDRRSAAQAGTRSNGHGLRSGGWSGGIAASAINPIVAPGTKDMDALIAGADRAILVPEALAGMFTANPTTGDFSGTVPFAFYIENGAIRHAVAHTTVGGNALAVLSSIRALGRTVVERRAAAVPPMHAGGVSCAN